MTASLMNEGPVMTVFTAALLRDTNYWDEVNDNMTDAMWWGRNKGCTFLTYDCTTLNTFEEFKTGSTKACNLGYDGYGAPSLETFSDNCKYISPYSNGSCEDIDNLTHPSNTYQNDMLEDFAYNSKCFDSTLEDPASGYNFPSAITRCHKS
jgi:proprotein convertase subtilisin/kexin type 5